MDRFQRILISLVIFSGFLLCSEQTEGQTPNRNIEDLQWVQNAASASGNSFKGAVFQQFGDFILPVYSRQIHVLNPRARASINVLETERITGSFAGELLDEFEVHSNVISVNGNYFLQIVVVPFRNSGQIERLKSFNIKVTYDGESQFQTAGLRKTGKHKTESVLAQGTWIKISTDREGIYVLDKDFFSSTSISASDIDLKTLKVYGNGGGLLPEIINDARTDDLEEVPLRIVDNNGNNKLDAGDKVFFYAQGATIWKFDPGSGRFIHQNHIYDSKNFYFLTFGGSDGKRVEVRTPNEGSAYEATLDHYKVMLLHEDDEVNFIESGRDWFGNSFRFNPIFIKEYNITDLLPNGEASLRMRATARSTNGSSMTVLVNGKILVTLKFDSVTGSYDDPYASTPKTSIMSFVPSSGDISLQFRYNGTSAEADAWIDYFEVEIPRQLKFTNGQYMMFCPQMVGKTATKFTFEATSHQIWDVTNHNDAFIQSSYDKNGKKEFIAFNPELSGRRYCAFDGTSGFSPKYEGKVDNQDLHGLSPVNYVMVIHSSMRAQAERLAEFHRNTYGSSVVVVDEQDIFNEFSSGKMDVVAIRDFLKMMYDRAQDNNVVFENVLLFGDGSYDYKDRVKNNTNLVPTYQSPNSTSPTSSYLADDFYVILEDGEGRFGIYEDESEGLDVGIGRIPAHSAEQARIYVDKVIRYHTPEGHGEWRNFVTLLADDEDQNRHFNDSENMAEIIGDQAPVLNINKIYLDAFEQVSYGSGQKYPTVNEAIDNSFAKGHLVFNYLGHGGGSGMAHERVVTRPQIRAWSNNYSLPLMITATCELSRFDDPAQDSPGELMLFDDNGGAIGLISTTRLVLIGLNSNLNEAVLDSNLFRKKNGEYSKLGQVYSTAFNNSYKRVNQRNFTMLGDPGIRLAFPKYNVVTTKVNDSIVGVNVMDTIKAFRKMHIEGEVRDLSGNLVTDFNGEVSPTVFDKTVEYSTLGNDPASKIATFYIQNSALYRGKVSVTNGKFFFEFVVPKDIDYRYGHGKISYYAATMETDANGYNDDIVIGGSAENQIIDSLPPEIKLFLDNTEFIFGGLTGENALLLANIYDENGVNTIGNGIGRDVTATLDGGTENEQIYVLNDFYQAKLNSYQEGEIRYQMSDLQSGRHTLKLKVWDVFNNSAEAYTEFVVAEDAALALDHVLNYPNPFTSNTTFHFDHNKSGRRLLVTVKIIAPSGRVVKTLYSDDIAAGGHFQGLAWDGKDEYGDNIGRGVYVYKVEVKSEDGTEATEYQKLVILK